MAGVNLTHQTLIKKAIEFIESTLAEPTSVDDVCEHVAFSKWEFQRLFRIYVGDSIGDYIRGRRLTEAANEIRTSASPIRLLDLAVKYQFGSHEAFSRSFKRQFGFAPSQSKDRFSEIRLVAKPVLTDEQLGHNLEGIAREPSIEAWSARHLVGIEAVIPSPFTEDGSFVGTVSELWMQFNPRRKEIKGRHRKIAYGLILNASEQMLDDELSYAAAVEVDQTSESELPAMMKSYQLSPQTYACFEKQGLADKTKLSIDYIYGFWLPQSPYRRANGIDVEIFDHRTRLDRADSTSTYCVPVNLRQS